MSTAHIQARASALPFAALLFAGALAQAGCDSLECGPGTHRAQDRCVPDVRVTCGAGATYHDGQCVGASAATGGAPAEADAGGGLTCGAGTHEVDGVCLPDSTGGGGEQPPAGGSPPPADGGTDAAPSPDMAAPPPRCPEALMPDPLPSQCDVPAGNNFCVVGLALDLLTGCALPEGTGVLLTDPIAAATGATPEQYTHGRSTVGPHGVFQVMGTGDSNSVGITLDDDDTLTAPVPGAGTLTRSSGGVYAGTAQFGMTYRTIALASSQAQQAVWNAALGQPDGFLETNGFMVGRVLTWGPGGTLLPVGDARPAFTRNPDMAACAANTHCLRFFTDSMALDGFQDVGATRTAASGAFLVIRGGATAFLDQVVVAEPEGYSQSPTSCGAAPGSGFHLPLLPPVPAQ